MYMRMVAPTVPYGAAGSLMGFPGTVSLGVEGLLTVLTAITDSLYRYGFRKFVIVNGHGGNVKSIELLGRRERLGGTVVIALQHRILEQVVLDFLLHLDRRKLQELDRLLQLGCQCQMLGEF